MAKTVAKAVKITKRGVMPGGAHFVIADGMADHIQIRLAAVAVNTATKTIVCLLLSNTAEFDKLGGLDTPAQVIKTYRAPRDYY